MKFIDIGVNLTDPMFIGQYNNNGKQYHEADLKQVLERAWSIGMEKIIITSGRLSEVKESLELIKIYDSDEKNNNSNNRLFTTIGVHPTRCSQELIINSNDSDGDSDKQNEIKQEYIEELLKFYNDNKEKIIAIGEFGLDYDRLEFCSKEIQLKCFEYQFQMTEKTGLPLFLHLRGSVESGACSDFIDILKRNRNRFSVGVVHSFTGTSEELNRLLELDGIYIGINGCSLKTQENLDVVSKIPINRLMIETDAPWCDIRKTHSSFKYIKTNFPSVKRDKFKLGSCVQNRNEPCNIINVLEVIVGLNGGDDKIEEISEQIYKNTINVFFPNQSK
ncbi:hypothetical protein RB653_006368 [Dictyostelium firmibasis]|uniref:Uncharacterized protein n=1 Tax=Dictyostelium firmibasis TaxID=79012 RepID=A0AAN7Z042_9MYCE